ncbi:endonuclease/exonuclease/phosphatase family protein [Leifsonia sp. McL0607]|uniref:endonuclease/exonuclease/phosphatase family protein n=1 Tax=Leifsonia sp. McL0607 TaxID=3415672 RepID=UPI003CE88563
MPRSRPRRPRGLLTGFVALAVGAVLLWHGLLPDTAGAASMLESFLPWLGVALVALGVAALVRLSLFAGLAVAAAMAVWWSAFGVALLPSMSAGSPRFTVVSENLHAQNVASADIARSLAARSPDVIALQELDADNLHAVEEVLDAPYPHHYVVGTVGIWSTHELIGGSTVDLAPGWSRGLSVDVDTPGAPTRVYVVHLASARPLATGSRDSMLETLTETVARDHAERLLVVGDLNTASTDRTLAPLQSELTEATSSSVGLGFTWPASFPAVRLDHAFVRGLTTVGSSVLDANGSDHRGIEVGLR